MKVTHIKLEPPKKLLVPWDEVPSGVVVRAYDMNRKDPGPHKLDKYLKLMDKSVYIQGGSLSRVFTSHFNARDSSNLFQFEVLESELIIYEE